MSDKFKMIQMLPGAPTARPVPRTVSHMKPRRRKFAKYPDRLNQVEAALATCVPEPQIRRRLAAQFGVSEATAGQYIKEVRDRWREDAIASGSMDREARRDQVRMQLQTVVMRAMNAQSSTGGKNPVTYPDPDLRAAIAGLRELKNLDGLDDAAPETAGPTIHSQFNVGLAFGPMGFKSPEEIRANLEELRERFATQGPAQFHGHISQPPAQDVLDVGEGSDDDQEG